MKGRKILVHFASIMIDEGVYGGCKKKLQSEKNNKSVDSQSFSSLTMRKVEGVT